ncbi:MAG: glycoside hydrolase family 97 protein [Candidatus Eisenbacteria bacterium]|nr:glycoside hydrolase family 97 protein [Candidatus Eisenbacteria bacterium]
MRQRGPVHSSMALVLALILSAPAAGGGVSRLAAPERDGAWTLVAPSGAVSMTVELIDGRLQYSVARADTAVLERSNLGMARADTEFESGLELAWASTPIVVDEDYTVPHGKVSRSRVRAVTQSIEFRNPSGHRMQLAYRVSDDGAAFRYRFPEASGVLHTVTDELTTFRIAANGRAILQRRWPESIHEIVPTESPPSSFGGWALPILFDLGHSWVMLGESDVDGSFCAAQIDIGARTREYRVILPSNNYGTREPSWTLPWEMPWRVVIVGPNAGAVIESNLVNDLADPCALPDASWIRPGRASWHWWSGASIGNMATLEAYVDLAQSMAWEYSLVDADWDDYHSEAAMQGLIDYAAARGVGVFLWYNSAGPQNGFTFSPRDRLWDPAVRRAEFDRLASWGVAGVKVDFFDSEKQIMIRHYLGILEDAAERGLLVSFHGSTPPRGWSRTWPNMVTTEAVRGAEYYKFNPDFPADAPLHNVRVAFTRNVVGPMDYTPVTFSDNTYAHLTSNAHELALSVVFESGLVHLADRISSYKSQPQVVQDFLSDLPVAWDEVQFIEGDPSTHVLLARRKGALWYLGGLNGAESPRSVSVDLTPFGYAGGGFRISDGLTPRTFSTGPIEGTSLALTIPPRGGFVARFPGAPSGIALDWIGDPLRRAEDRSGIFIDRICPNPFTGSTLIAYTLQSGAAVRLAVYAPSGRRVRALVDARQTAGRHAAIWDGRDEGGMSAPSGVYYFRLAADGEVATGSARRLR